MQIFLILQYNSHMYILIIFLFFSSSNALANSALYSKNQNNAYSFVHIKKETPYNKHFAPWPFRINSDVSQILKDKTNGKTLYQVDYKIGKFANRLTHERINIIEKEKIIVLAGGSNTFGEWVNDKNTLSHKLAQMTIGSHNLYDLSCKGCSPSNLLYNLQYSGIKSVLKNKHIFVIYNFHDFHILRDTCHPSTSVWNHGNVPYYSLKNDKMIFSGFCRDQISFKFIKFKQQISEFILKTLKQVGFNPTSYSSTYKRVINEANQEHTVNIFKEIGRELKKISPKSSFHVFTNPIQGFSDSTAEKITQGSGIFYKTIPYHQVQKTDPSKFMFPFDGHINEAGYKFLSEYFYNYLIEMNFVAGAEGFEPPTY